MGRKPSSDQATETQSARKDRLKAALKANLQRRKAQTRARKVQATEETPPEPGGTDNNRAG